MQLPLSNCSHILLWYFPHLGYSISKYSTEQGVRGSGQPVTVTLSALPDEPLALLGGTVLSSGNAFEETLGRCKFCPHLHTAGHSLINT